MAEKGRPPAAEGGGSVLGGAADLLVLRGINDSLGGIAGGGGGGAGTPTKWPTILCIFWYQIYVPAGRSGGGGGAGGASVVVGGVLSGRGGVFTMTVSAYSFGRVLDGFNSLGGKSGSGEVFEIGTSSFEGSGGKDELLLLCLACNEGDLFFIGRRGSGTSALAGGCTSVLGGRGGKEEWLVSFLEGKGGRSDLEASFPCLLGGGGACLEGIMAGACNFSREPERESFGGSEGNSLCGAPGNGSRSRGLGLRLGSSAGGSEDLLTPLGIIPALPESNDCLAEGCNLDEGGFSLAMANDFGLPVLVMSCGV